MTKEQGIGGALIKLVICYLLGVAVAALIMGLSMASPGIGLLAIPVGAVLGLPVLLAACLIFVAFEQSIRRNPTPWCCASPFVVAALFAVLLTLLFYDGKPHWPELLEYTGLSFVGGTVAAVMFRFWALEAPLPAPF